LRSECCPKTPRPSFEGDPERDNDLKRVSTALQALICGRARRVDRLSD